jgi:hypothetical protein
MFQFLSFILDYLADGSKHFLLAFLAGLLAWLLTSTILFAPYSLISQLIHRRTSTVVVYGILICSLLLAISAALASHWALDYFSIWYSTPLGPHLELTK